MNTFILDVRKKENISYHDFPIDPTRIYELWSACNCNSLHIYMQVSFAKESMNPKTSHDQNQNLSSLARVNINVFTFIY